MGMERGGGPDGAGANKLTRDEKLNRLISLLARNRWASKEDQLAAVGERSPDVLRKTWHPKLVKEGYAVRNPVLLPDSVRKGYARFWVFIQTQYDEGHAIEVREAMGDDHRYQDWICKRLSDRLMELHADTMRVGGAEVLLGGGGWDLIFIIDAAPDSASQVHKFVTCEVRTCPHIARSSTGWSPTP